MEEQKEEQVRRVLYVCCITLVVKCGNLCLVSNAAL